MASFSAWEKNLWTTALDLRVVRFSLSHITTLGSECYVEGWAVGIGLLAFLPQQETSHLQGGSWLSGTPLFATVLCPRLSSCFTSGVVGRREPPPLGHIWPELSYSNRQKRAEEKCLQFAPPRKIPLWLRAGVGARGREPAFLAAVWELVGAVRGHWPLRVGWVKGESGSSFTYHRP